MAAATSDAAWCGNAVLAKMIGNIVIDLRVGSVPVVGDIFDFH